MPDIIACRCSSTLEKVTIEKIALFCQVKSKQVLSVHDVESTYLVPSILEKQGLREVLWEGLSLDRLTIPSKLKDRGTAIWSEWKRLTDIKDQIFGEVKIALVNKYDLRDSFLSVSDISHWA
jgi:CTP synthase